MTVFTLPYAVGNSTAFTKFKWYLERNLDNVTVINLDYPGHGTRFTETLCKKIEDIARDMYIQMNRNEQFQLGNYSIVGYSMGSIVCHEILQILKRNKKSMPKCVLFMACDAPGFEPLFTDCLSYDTDDVKRILRTEGGTPKEVLECSELIEVLKDIVRCDYFAIETYRTNLDSVDENTFAETNFYVIRGNEETYDERLLHRWDSFYGGKIVYRTLPGKHFFLFENGENLAAVCEILKEVII